MSTSGVSSIAIFDYQRTMKTSWTKTLTGHISPGVLTTHKSPIYTFAKVNYQNDVEHPWKPVVSRSEHDVHPQWEAPLLGPWLEVATVLHVDIATLADAWRKASENNMTPLNGRSVLWDLHGFASYRMYTLHLQHRSSEKKYGWSDVYVAVWSGEGNEFIDEHHVLVFRWIVYDCCLVSHFRCLQSPLSAYSSKYSKTLCTLTVLRDPIDANELSAFDVVPRQLTHVANSSQGPVRLCTPAKGPMDITHGRSPSRWFSKTHCQAFPNCRQPLGGMIDTQHQEDRTSGSMWSTADVAPGSVAKAKQSALWPGGPVMKIQQYLPVVRTNRGPNSYWNGSKWCLPQVG